MKKSTKFFILTMVVNIILSLVIVWDSMRELRLVDIVTFYATAFGAGASCASVVISLRSAAKNKTTNS